MGHVTWHIAQRSTVCYCKCISGRWRLVDGTRYFFGIMVQLYTKEDDTMMIPGFLEHSINIHNMFHGYEMRFSKFSKERYFPQTREEKYQPKCCVTPISLYKFQMNKVHFCITFARMGYQQCWFSTNTPVRTRDQNKLLNLPPSHLVGVIQETA